MGFKATWSAGLVFGVVLLLANNPMGRLPRLRNRRLVMYLPLIVAITAACGVVGGWLGYRGYLNRLDGDFAYCSRQFVTAWGVHLGGYAGGLIGTIVAAAIVLRARFAKV